MGIMSEVPSSERVQIGFFGIRNAGKSSVVNAVTGQNLSVISDTPGTTTDPVRKAMEISPIGPVVVIDTPGFDDEGELGTLRVVKTKETLRRVDVAVLVVDSTLGMRPKDRELLDIFEKLRIPYIVALNKTDLMLQVPEAQAGMAGAVCQSRASSGTAEDLKQSGSEAGQRTVPHAELAVSAKTGWHIRELKDLIGRLGKAKISSLGLLDGLIEPGDLFVLVIPQDASAPKGRLILPEQMVIHEILDHASMALCCQPPQLRQTLAFLAQSGKKIRMVITDSQAFSEVSKAVPEEIPLASFSILMARYKGVLEEAARGVKAVDMLQDGDKVLMSEGCTHHRQCQDIGTVKIPAWLRAYTKKSISIETSSGFGFPEDLSPYRMVIHCGGCMLNEREVQSRMRQAREQGVPFTNYGITIAYMNGILQRSAKAIGLAL
ncbi:MAG: [FeFe] hydrogenase H-cluster maturation GTPase HydF [Porcincola intestinalis]|uniref:[FeFe] hydrogenase H-cluster maturation GTPase HydF n=1 Tax=Porcincola intestinalis TaxID=2606632 RepID=UPI0029DBA795|nr:[FeFe] hydrogenase H-cluster maturation GTPase HydF [Porcincola intestinalis]MCI6238621.1 [FeFe] hydrogenase H-cluster maturation GTPase HydF [Lachnospiraceae bacterium]MDY5333264.1 [FeFe] hydrogenase H-cluster maturation GTPase HydF [Porcincola intestinalis]